MTALDRWLPFQSPLEPGPDIAGLTGRTGRSTAFSSVRAPLWASAQSARSLSSSQQSVGPLPKKSPAQAGGAKGED
jgi:hypothetical protein